MHPPIAVTQLEEALLLALYNFRYLTVCQLARLVQKESISNYIRERLNTLIAQHLVNGQYLPRAEKSGRTPRVYSLTRQGMQMLNLDAAEETPINLPRQRSYLPHTLAVNDVLIAATLLEHVEPAIHLRELRAEHLLRTHPVQLGKTTMLMPDGFLHFTLSPPFGRPGESVGIVFEIDRNTEDSHAIQAKIKNYLACSNGSYQNEFGIESLTIAFLVSVGGERRLSALRSFAHQALKQQAPEDADLFLFTSLDETTTIDPRSLFCGEVWLPAWPESTVRKPLIEQLYRSGTT